MTPVATATKTQLQVDSWQKLADNVWKTDLGAGLPEIVLLQVSNGDFKSLRSSEAAAMAYLDPYMKAKLNGCLFESITSNGDSENDWIMLNFHSIDSMDHIDAWQCRG